MYEIPNTSMVHVDIWPPTYVFDFINFYMNIYITLFSLSNLTNNNQLTKQIKYKKKKTYI